MHCRGVVPGQRLRGPWLQCTPWVPTLCQTLARPFHLLSQRARTASLFSCTPPPPRGAEALQPDRPASALTRSATSPGSLHAHAPHSTLIPAQVPRLAAASTWNVPPRTVQGRVLSCCRVLLQSLPSLSKVTLQARRSLEGRSLRHVDR